MTKPLFEITGTRMKCLRCGSVTEHPKDVEHRYCAQCHRFLDPTIDGLVMWTIYDHPKDAPDKFVAREWLVYKDATIGTNRVLASDTLDALREAMRREGLVCLTRDPTDDPVIVETWL